VAEVGDGGDDFGELVRVFKIVREEAVVPGTGRGRNWMPSTV